MSAHIANAPEEQNAVAEEINHSIVAIRDIIGKSARGVREMASVSEAPTCMTDELLSQVHVFRFGGAGSAASARDICPEGMA